jgi:oligopeptide transport system ATP-binding protein
MQNNQEVLLKVENLCQYFGPTKAVDNVSFDIKKGEVFGLVGESGCGKTTTGRSIIKLYNITGGNVYFKGIRIAAGTKSYKDAIAKAKADFKEQSAAHPEKAAELKAQMNEIIAEQRKQMKAAANDQKNCDKEYSKQLQAQCKEKYEALLAKADDSEKAKLTKEYKNEMRKAKNTKLVTQIQMIFQDPIASLDPRMTVKEIISEGLVIQGERDKAVLDEKVFKMLETVGLVREHATRYPHEFSGGQRQRIGVARSVVMNPELIIADEPVSALDVSVQAQVINLLNELREQMGLTILFVAHDLSVVKYFSDRIGVMYFGKMVELADSDELFRNPMHPYTKSLLSAIPLPDPIYEKTRQRIVYNPLAAHDYSVDKPSFREIAPGHFVMCNDAEFEQYQKEMK